MNDLHFNQSQVMEFHSDVIDFYQMRNVKSYGTKSKTLLICSYQICLLNSPIKYVNEFIVVVWNEHFSVNKSLADYVILSKKINLFLLNKTLYNHGSKLPITNITVVSAY